MRHITLMLQNGKRKDLQKIKDWCNKNNIEFEYRYSRDNSLKQYKNEDELSTFYYFTIFTDTSHYLELQKLMGEKVITTDYADICNLVDGDDQFEEEFKSILNDLQKAKAMQAETNHKFNQFIMKIKRIDVLQAIKEYVVYMNQTQEMALNDRIKILGGKQEEINEEFTSAIQSIHTNVKDLREKYNMSRRDFARYFDIPYSQVEAWEEKKDICPIYLYKLMEEKLEHRI